MKIAEQTSIMTSQEIGYLTQTAHEFVLERACDQLIGANINPNDFWHEYVDYESGATKKRLHLPKREYFLAISDEWYSNKARAAVTEVFAKWERNDAETHDSW